MKAKFSCVDLSKTYQQIVKSKHNRKTLLNGDSRIGNDMAVNSKTQIIYKL